MNATRPSFALAKMTKLALLASLVFCGIAGTYLTGCSEEGVEVGAPGEAVSGKTYGLDAIIYTDGRKFLFPSGSFSAKFVDADSMKISTKCREREAEIRWLDKETLMVQTNKVIRETCDDKDAFEFSGWYSVIIADNKLELTSARDQMTIYLSGAADTNE